MNLRCLFGLAGIVVVLACSGSGSPAGPDPNPNPNPNPGPALGSRTNPVPRGQAITIRLRNQFIWGNGDLEVTLVSVIRGPVANQMVADGNQFNELPPAGEEYLLARFRFRVLDDLDGTGIEVNHARLDLVARGVVDNRFIVVSGVEPDIRTTIFEGGQHEGFTYFLVDQGEQDLLALWDGAVFFDLTS